MFVQNSKRFSNIANHTILRNRRIIGYHPLIKEKNIDNNVSNCVLRRDVMVSLAKFGIECRYHGQAPNKTLAFNSLKRQAIPRRTADVIGRQIKRMFIEVRERSETRQSERNIEMQSINKIFGSNNAECGLLSTVELISKVVCLLNDLTCSVIGYGTEQKEQLWSDYIGIGPLETGKETKACVNHA